MLPWNFKNFGRHEFVCHADNSLPEIAEINYHGICICFLQPLRSDIGKPIYIESAYRTILHNRNEDGGSKSYHIIIEENKLYRPTAVDFKVYGLPQYFVADRIKEHTNINYCGYKMYIDQENYCQGHIDFRGFKARW